MISDKKILIKKVNYDDITKKKGDPLFKTNIYKLVSRPCDNLKLFMRYPKSKIEQIRSLNKVKGNEQLANCYYINHDELTIYLNVGINLDETDHHLIDVTLVVTYKFVILNSDAGNGLSSWLENEIPKSDDDRVLLDDILMKKYVAKKLTKEVVENIIRLRECSLDELQDGEKEIEENVVRRALGFKYDWVSVTCKVRTAIDNLTMSQIMREKSEKDHQKKREDHERKMELLNWENEERGMQLDAIIGKPFIAASLVLEIKDVRLELETKREVILGKTKSTADVSMGIPEKYMDETNRVDLNKYISREHARLEHLGETVQIKPLPRKPTHNPKNPQNDNESPITLTYLNGDRLSLNGQIFSDDVELWFSSMVRWKCRVQKRMNDAGVEKISSLVLNYPSCNDLYKIFVWPSCRLKAVDSRLPDWRIAYQAGAHGSEGAFYVTTSTGRSIYLNPQQSVVENVAVKYVND
jgi:hypothetical protein